MLILGLDMSSVCLGYALLRDGQPGAIGHFDLDGDIARRAHDAAARVRALYAAHLPALVVIESPVARFAKAVLPQARVSGAVLATLHSLDALWCEVAPSAAKVALCDDGAATKREMVEAAADALGVAHFEVRTWRGKAWAFTNGEPWLSEDEADALGLARAGLAVKVQTREAA